MKSVILFFLLSINLNKDCNSVYILQAKPSPIIGCGGFLFAGQYLFINSQDSSNFIGVIKCPDGYGDDFFKEDGKYEIEFSKDTALPKEYSWMNVFDYPADMRPPIKFIEKIKRAN